MVWGDFVFAVITELCETDADKKIEVCRMGELLNFRVGKKVSHRRLKRALNKFNGEYIFSTTFDTRGLAPCSTDRLKTAVLFEQFADHVLSSVGIGLTVGIVDRDGKILENDTVTHIIAHAESVIICTLRENIDELCRGWLLLTGTCPEITADPKHLLECNCVFSPDLRVATVGLLFGKGGLNIDREKIELPEIYLPLVEAGVDPVDLTCLLTASRSAITVRTNE